ncbi:MFS transporter [Anaerosacchariphilus polymeriproducens]|nr:MFS transporter [Anaerosacchariphilus polymeriproducens]
MENETQTALISEKNFNRMLLKFYILDGLKQAFFYIPILVIYYQGIMDREIQVAILLSIKTFSVNLLEIPTGFVADHISRKVSVLLGVFISIISLGIIVLFQNFWWLCVAQFLFALSETLSSGADKAFLFDNLKYYNKQIMYDKVNCNMHFNSSLILSLSFITGGILYNYWEMSPFVLSIILFIVSFIVGLTIHEENYDEVDSSGNRLKKMKAFYRIKTQSKKLWFYIIYTSVIRSFFYSVYLFIYPLLLISNTIPKPYFGIVYSAAVLIYGFGSKLSVNIRNISRFIVIYVSLFTGVLYVVIGFNTNALIFIGLIMFVRLIWGAFAVISNNEINKMIKQSSVRSTILSVANAIGNVFSSGLIFIYGILLNSIVLKNVMIVTGILLICLGLLSVLVKRFCNTIMSS